MNYKNLLSFLLIATSYSATAQNAAATYAITGDGNGDFTWMNIRKVDVASGKLVSTVYDRLKPAGKLVDAATKKLVVNEIVHRNGRYSGAEQPTSTYVAAAAYDKKHNKLFFTPMRRGELRWIDFDEKNEQPTFYTEKQQLLNTLNLNDEANHITRMDIGADGNGYAITNDGNHLIKFTTGKKTIITDLGALIDDEGNNLFQFITAVPVGVAIWWQMLMVNYM
jgi:hypothetical protein